MAGRGASSVSGVALGFWEHKLSRNRQFHLPIVRRPWTGLMRGTARRLADRNEPAIGCSHNLVGIRLTLGCRAQFGIKYLLGVVHLSEAVYLFSASEVHGQHVHTHLAEGLLRSAWYVSTSTGLHSLQSQIVHPEWSAAPAVVKLDALT